MPGTRQLGARYDGIVVTSTESVDFWYRCAGTVVPSTEIVDFRYPKYRDSSVYNKDYVFSILQHTVVRVGK